MKTRLVLSLVLVAMTSLLSFSHTMPLDCVSVANQLDAVRREFALREQRIKKLREPRGDKQRRQAELHPAIKGWAEMVALLRAEQERYNELLQGSDLESDDKLVAKVAALLQVEDQAVDVVRKRLHELRDQINESQSRGDTKQQIQRWEDMKADEDTRLKAQHVRQVIYQRMLIQVKASGRGGLERERRVVSQLLGSLEPNLQALREESRDLELDLSAIKAEILTAERNHENQRGYINRLQAELDDCRNRAGQVTGGGRNSCAPNAGQEVVQGAMLREQNGLLYFNPCNYPQCYTQQLSWIELYKVVCKVKIGTSIVAGGPRDVYQIVYKP